MWAIRRDSRYFWLNQLPPKERWCEFSKDAIKFATKREAEAVLYSVSSNPGMQVVDVEDGEAKCKLQLDLELLNELAEHGLIDLTSDKVEVKVDAKKQLRRDIRILKDSIAREKWKVKAVNFKPVSKKTISWQKIAEDLKL